MRACAVFYRSPQRSYIKYIEPIEKIAIAIYDQSRNDQLDSLCIYIHVTQFYFEIDFIILAVKQLVNELSGRRVGLVVDDSEHVVFPARDFSRFAYASREVAAAACSSSSRGLHVNLNDGERRFPSGASSLARQVTETRDATI